jgi:hypothetical protein
MSILLVFAALLMGMARAINLKELTEKVEYLQKTPFVVLTLIYDSEKSNKFGKLRWKSGSLSGSAQEVQGRVF